MNNEYRCFAFLSSKSGELYYFLITYSKLKGYFIDVCNKEKICVGGVRLSIEGDITYFYNFFVSEELRGEYLGRRLIEIVDYIIKNRYFKIIYGTFEPFELKKKHYDLDELTSKVRTFYEKNHFSIVSRQEYLENIDSYFGLEEKFFICPKRLLIYRNYIPDEYSFYQSGNVLIHNSMICSLDEIQEFADRNLHRLSLKVQ